MLNSTLSPSCGAGPDRGSAIVTGARRGIGAAIALSLAQAGFKVALVDIVEDDDARAALAAVQQLQPAARFYAADLARIEGHAALLQQIASDFDDITCLVSNAGVQMNPRCDIFDVTPAEFDRVMGVNIRGNFFLMQAFAKVVSQDDSRYRAIVSISSLNATAVSTEKSVYCLSKAALAMANSLYAVRYAEMGIAVFDVRPGAIRTEMTRAVWDALDQVARDGASPIRRVGLPQEVAQTVCTLATGGLPYNTGDTIHVGGGIQIQRL